eukprot:246358_1
MHLKLDWKSNSEIMSTTTRALSLLSIFTLSVAIQYDKFGIEQLYKSVDNGLNFEPGWNTIDRTVSSVDVDEYSTEQKCHARGGNSVFDIDSSTGIMTMDGDTPRYYCYLDHTNVEVTAYAKRGSESSFKSYQGLTIVARSSHKDYSDDYCKAKGYYFRLYNDGRACFLKEFIHSSSCLIYTASSHNPCVNSFDASSSNGGVSANKWYGMKLVIQNDEINNKVNLRGYIDFTDGLNGGNWQLLLEYNDSNKWVAEVESSEQWCMNNCGYNGNENWFQQSNSIFLRSSYVNNYQWKYFTIREIIPFIFNDATPAPIAANSQTFAPISSPTLQLQYIVVENHDSTQEYYLSFVLKNIDASACSDSISDVEIHEENVWRSYDQSFSGARYSFQKRNVKFTDELPISVRILMSSDKEIILSNIIADLVITSVFVTDQSICQKPQTQRPSNNPTKTPQTPNQIQTINPTQKTSTNPIESHLFIITTQDNDRSALEENTGNEKKGATVTIVMVILGILLVIIAMAIGIYFYHNKKYNVTIEAQTSDNIEVEMIDGKLESNGDTQTLNSDNDVQQNITAETK